MACYWILVNADVLVRGGCGAKSKDTLGVSFFFFSKNSLREFQLEGPSPLTKVYHPICRTRSTIKV